MWRGLWTAKLFMQNLAITGPGGLACFRQTRFFYIYSVACVVGFKVPGTLAGLFVRSFVLCGQESSLLWTPAHRPSAGPMCLPQGERELVSVCSVCVMCRKGGLTRRE